jgi:hypothetical protein
MRLVQWNMCIKNGMQDQVELVALFG